MAQQKGVGHYSRYFSDGSSTLHISSKMYWMDLSPHSKNL
jgi:hypothetical protein